MGVTDAHNHLWISPKAVAGGASFVLDQEEQIRQELIEYRMAGGGSQVDCQPGGAGRDGNRLRSLSEASGVSVVACTGFHLRQYYSEGSALWEMDLDAATGHFLSEIHEGLSETRDQPSTVFPGFVKIAVLASVGETPLGLIEAAVNTCVESGYAMVMHTESGAAVEDFLDLLAELGLPPERLVVCHIDKRPDFSVHRELAQAGCLLEYDTFFRPKYQPEKNLWRLLPEMVEAGYGQSIALATDLADKQMWRTMGDGPGLVGFVQDVRERLEREIADPALVSDLMGGNIARRLAIPLEEFSE